MYLLYVFEKNILDYNFEKKFGLHGNITSNVKK